VRNYLKLPRKSRIFCFDAESKICDDLPLMNQKEITSLQHPLIKHFVKLREDKEYRYEQKRVVISGVKMIRELSRQFPLRTLLIGEGLPLSETPRADTIFSVPSQILKKVTGLENPEPIAAEIDMPTFSDFSPCTYLLVLDGISDPGNLGTLLRTAKALGWEGAFITQGSTDPYNDKAIRSAKGATFTLPWIKGTWGELSLLLEKNKMTLLAADAKGKPLKSCSLPPPIALALGNEAHGLNDTLKKRAELLAIPMHEGMESLNVATAGAILMYSLREKR
jgi:RNA methyltransferase, TrmH family